MRLLFKSFFIAFVISTLAGGVWVIWLLANFPYTKIEPKLLVIANKTAGERSVLEAGTSITRKALINYLLFAGELPEKWIEEKIENGRLGKLVDENEQRFLIKDEIELSGLLRNDCQQQYCFQHKISFEKIPSPFWKALIGIEDIRYLDHAGVDYLSILRALITDVIHLEFKQGGSTLTQQIVKNLFFSNEKTIVRKLKEIIYAFYLESRFTKEEILALYLNEAYWGSFRNTKVIGFYAAALFYFNKVPQEISSFEATVLISMLKGPAYYNPAQANQRLRDRATWMFDRLSSTPEIGFSIHNRWTQDQWEFWEKKWKEKTDNQYYEALALVTKDVAAGLFSSFEKYIFEFNARKTLAVIKERYPAHDLAIKAFFVSLKNEGSSVFRYYSKVERNLDNAIVMEKHQIGSTIKPILYYIFKQYGKNLTDRVSTKKITLSLKSGKWEPAEAHQIKEESITLIEALQKSLNNPVIRLAEEIGWRKIETSLLTYVGDLKTPLNEYPSQLLGSIEISLHQLAEMYKRLINDECDKVSSGLSSWEGSLLQMMSDPKKTTIAKSVGKTLSEMQFFGKTGTTNSGFDNWFVYFDGKILGVVWLGHEGIREKSVKLNLFGSTTAFKLLEAFLADRGRRLPELMCY